MRALRHLARVGDAMRPRGSLANDTTARVLQLLLVGLLVWFAFYMTIILPFFNVKKAVSALIALLGALVWCVALVLVRRGLFRRAALVYLCAMFLLASVTIVLYGGIRSAAVIFYLALPISAAWLLGERAAMVSAAICLAASFILALLETVGVQIPRYFPGTPIGIWALVMLATIASAPPVVIVLRMLRETLAQSLSLSSRLLKVQDEERQRLARELHDSTAQSLSALGMNLGGLKDEASQSLSSRARLTLAESIELVDQCIREIRTFAYLLHPPVLEVLGLESALKTYVDGFVRRSGIRVELMIPPDLGRLPGSLETAIFRIVQESLANVHRHSGSKVARISITRSPVEVALEVKDEGHGLPADALKDAGRTFQAGVGIAGTRERLRELGGRLELDSNQPHGTIVRAILPVH